MSDRRRATYYVDGNLLDGLKVVKEQIGMTESEQVRRALRLWLEQVAAFDPRPRLMQLRPGAERELKAARKRAATRKRA